VRRTLTTSHIPEATGCGAASSRRLALALATAGGVCGTAAAAYVVLMTGRLTVDLGVGRRTRPLGPPQQGPPCV